MNQNFINRVLKNDPREKKQKSQREIFSEWREKKLFGIVFSIPFFSAVFYLVYWAIGQANNRAFSSVAELPSAVRWAVGIAVFCAFSWALYGLSSYRCPKCGGFTGMDWSFGLSLLNKPSENSKFCSQCQTRLE